MALAFMPLTSTGLGIGSHRGPNTGINDTATDVSIATGTLAGGTITVGVHAMAGIELTSIAGITRSRIPTATIELLSIATKPTAPEDRGTITDAESAGHAMAATPIHYTRCQGASARRTTHSWSSDVTSRASGTIAEGRGRRDRVVPRVLPVRNR